VWAHAPNRRAACAAARGACRTQFRAPGENALRLSKHGMPARLMQPRAQIISKKIQEPKCSTQLYYCISIDHPKCVGTGRRTQLEARIPGCASPTSDLCTLHRRTESNVSCLQCVNLALACHDAYSGEEMWAHDLCTWT
jgi:hypothetical protein